MTETRAPKTRFAAALKRPGPILLDGGLATQLDTRGCDIGNALWSASILISDTQAIVDAHRDFLDAGAEIIATASYQASRTGFMKFGKAADAANKLMLSSVDLARRARDEYLCDNPNSGHTPMIAASLGPFGAAQHDGSEYTGEYDVGAERLVAFHRDRLRLFDGSNADVLALETIPSLTEAKVLAELLCDVELPAWISFSCRDARHISDGTALEDVVALFRHHPQVLAIGVNCTPPQYVVQLVRSICKVAPDKAILAYPNSGESYNAADNSWSGTVTPLDLAVAVQDWVTSGAKLVGGCCRVGPEHIRAMRDSLNHQAFR